MTSAHAPRGAFDDQHTGSPYAPRDACGVGFIARQSGERTHEVVQLALAASARLAHRGASATDSSADGAGLLTQIPKRFFILAASRMGLHVSADTTLAVGMFFLPADPTANSASVAVIEDVLRTDALPLLGWRDVPVRADVLGPSARSASTTERPRRR